METLNMVQIIVGFIISVLTIGVSWGIIQSFRTQTKEDIKGIFARLTILEIENNNIKVKFETIMAALNLHEKLAQVAEAANKQNWDRIFLEVGKNEKKLEDLLNKYNSL